MKHLQNFKRIVTKGIPVILLIAFVGLSACNDDEGPTAQPTGESDEFLLSAINDSGISGTAKLEKLDNGATRLTLTLNGTTSTGSHPAHIHSNTAAEGGGIAIDLSNVDGATGTSVTEITTLNDGNTVTYEALIDFDGYINIHNSSDDLGTLLAQGDIGQNALTGLSEDYELFSVSDPNISGEITLYQRRNEETLAEIVLEGDAVDSDRPAHIHNNNAAESGGIAIDLSNVTNGISKTNIVALNDGTVITYEGLKDFDGYVNVHNSASDLSTLVGQGDIGQNALTGESESYTLNSVSNPNISGTIQFSERRNDETLVEIELSGDASESDHPTHIHANTAAEGGGIIIDLVNVMNGGSKSNVSALNDGTIISYQELTDLDAYVNVHNTSEDLGTIVAQGDIGQNAFTGESFTYELSEKDVTGISGTARIQERINGTTLLTLNLVGTPQDGIHPAHIHENDAATGGGILISLTSVDGNTGISKTQVEQLDEGTAITYDQLLDFNGYINVHLSESELSTIVAQGDIGSNDDPGGTQEINYDVTNNGSTAYIFNGNGMNNMSNPNFTLQRGKTYTFTVNTPGHPFYINSTQGTGTSNAFDDGVTNNGASSGTITFTVPSSAPNTLFYNCEFHSSMTGTITITD